MREGCHRAAAPRAQAMEEQTGDLTMFRYELVHGVDAEFIAYKRQLDGGIWQTLSRWIIPGTYYRD
jgi:hypothetical protein